MFYTQIFTRNPQAVSVCWRLIAVALIPWKTVCPTASSVESKELAKNNHTSTVTWLRCNDISMKGGTEMVRSILPLRKSKTNRDKISFKDSFAKITILAFSLHTKCSEQIKEIVHKHWHMIRSDDHIGNVFSKPPLVLFSQGRNLRDQLINSDLPHQNTSVRTTSQVFNEMALTNVDPSNTPKQGNRSQSKVYSHAPLRQWFIF